MEEIIEQYNNTKKWKREMLILMAVMLVVAAAIIVWAFVIKALMAVFLIAGGLVAALGAAVFIVSNATFKKVDKLVREYLTANGKSAEEINSILGAK